VLILDSVFMNCPSCNRPNQDGKKFCSSCGTSLLQSAPKSAAHCACGAEIRPGKKFCHGCGASVALAVAPEPKSVALCACGAEIRRGKKFCHSCGSTVASSGAVQVSADSVSKAVEDKSKGEWVDRDLASLSRSLSGSSVVWQLEKGALVQSVDARKAAALCLAKKFVIAPGTRVLIFVDGQLKGELSSGVFDLPTIALDRIPGYRPGSDKPSPRNGASSNSQVDPATGGALGILDWAGRQASRFGNWFVENVVGRRESQLSPERQRERANARAASAGRAPNAGQQAQSEAFQINPLVGDSVRWDPTFSAVSGDHVVHFVLAREGAFRVALVYNKLMAANQVSADEVGVDLEIQISDLKAFHSRFVNGDTLTTDGLTNELLPLLETAVAEQVRSLQPSEMGNSDRVNRLVEAALTAELGRSASGVAVRRVLKLTFSRKELDELRARNQELVIAREGLETARQQHDFQELLRIEEVRKELMEGASAEERRRAFRELQEITRGNNDLALDRQGLELSRGRLGFDEEAQSVSADRRKMEIEFERVFEQMESGRRLEMAQNSQEEAVALQEIEERGFLKAEALEILKEQVASRRRQREREQGHEDWMSEEGFSQDRMKTGLINAQFIALLEIEQDNERSQKQRDWDYKFLSEDQLREFELQRAELERSGALRSISMGQELDEADHHGKLSVVRREQMRLELVAKVGFEQLYADNEMVKLQSQLKQQGLVSAQAIEDAKAGKEIANIKVDASVYAAEADIALRVKDQTASIEIERQRKAMEEEETRSDFERLKEMNRLKQEDEDKKREHSLLTQKQQIEAEQERLRIENERIRIEAERFHGMTAEQILVANPNISEAAARAYAEANSGKAEKEALRREAEREREIQLAASAQNESMLDRMERMAAAQMAAAVQMSGNAAGQIRNAQEQLLYSEREKTHQAQAHTQQFVQGVQAVTQSSFGAAAHAATGASASAAPAPVQGGARASQQRKCPQCACNVPGTESFCDECGTKVV
jgi:hypothetical protein